MSVTLQGLSQNHPDSSGSMPGLRYQIGSCTCAVWCHKHPAFYTENTLKAGWWCTYPSKKYESQLGWLFPIYGKIQNKPPTRYWKQWILQSYHLAARSYHQQPAEGAAGFPAHQSAAPLNVGQGKKSQASWVPWKGYSELSNLTSFENWLKISKNGSNGSL